MPTAVELIPLGGSAFAHPALEPLLVPVGDVLPHPDNPRRSDADVIADSLAVNGLFRPLVAQRSSAFVLAGNHTLRALASLGAERVPVTWLDVDDRAAARIILADNRTADLGGYDITALVEVLDSLGEDAYSGTGYAETDLDQLLVDLQGAGEVSKNAAGYYEAVGEAGGQRTDVNAEWAGMPEFVSNDLTPHRQLLVSFASDGDVDEFCRRLELAVTSKTRFLWFPPAEWDDTRGLRYAHVAAAAEAPAE